jgi:threonine/homoserine/homoserine lactone efflux protein
MTKKDLTLRCVLALIMNLVNATICVFYCQKSLILISKDLADVFYFFMIILFTIITVLILLAPRRIRDLFGKDMLQTLIDHGNITG